MLTFLYVHVVVDGVILIR